MCPVTEKQKELQTLFSWPLEPPKQYFKIIIAHHITVQIQFTILSTGTNQKLHAKLNWREQEWRLDNVRSWRHFLPRIRVAENKTFMNQSMKGNLLRSLSSLILCRFQAISPPLSCFYQYVWYSSVFYTFHWGNLKVSQIEDNIGVRMCCPLKSGIQYHVHVTRSDEGSICPIQDIFATSWWAWTRLKVTLCRLELNRNNCIIWDSFV